MTVELAKLVWSSRMKPIRITPLIEETVAQAADAIGRLSMMMRVRPLRRSTTLTTTRRMVTMPMMVLMTSEKNSNRSQQHDHLLSFSLSLTLSPTHNQLGFNHEDHLPATLCLALPNQSRGDEGFPLLLVLRQVQGVEQVYRSYRNWTQEISGA